MEEMKVKIEAKSYKCEYCGKKHASPIDRARCELKCDENKLIENKRQDYAEIRDLLKALNLKLTAYQDKYNEKIQVSGNCPNFKSLW